MKLKLKYPVNLATGETLTELTIRRPKVADIGAIGSISNETEQGITLSSRLTGLVIEDLNELDLADFTALSEIIAGMTKGTTTDPKA